MSIRNPNRFLCGTDTLETSLQDFPENLDDVSLLLQCLYM